MERPSNAFQEGLDRYLPPWILQGRTSYQDLFRRQMDTDLRRGMGRVDAFD